MKEQDDNKLDLIFKQGLDNDGHNIVFRNEDWNAMEKLLDEGKKRRGIIYFLPLISSIAAMLLLTAGFFYFNTKPNTAQQHTIARIKPVAKPSPYLNNPSIAKNQNTLTATVTGNLPQATPATSLVKASPNPVSGLNPPVFTAMIKQAAGNVQTDRVPTAAPALNSNKKDSLAEHMASVTATLVPVKDSSVQQVIAAVNPQKIIPDTIPKVITPPAVKGQPKATLKAIGFKHPVVLSIMAAPDFNGVGSSFSRTQIGTNAGLMLSVGVTHKLTVSAGAVYAKKPYSIGFAQYYTVYKFKVQPTDVAADCRVLDIPINIDYRLYSKGPSQFSIGTGISSYFMLRENYHFNYAGGTPLGPTDYNIANQNKHLLGVLNLDATYQRRINQKLGLNVQPYMKLPLTNIGYGRVNLQSTGVAVGVSWYLNSSPKK